MFDSSGVVHVAEVAEEGLLPLPRTCVRLLQCPALRDTDLVGSLLVTLLERYMEWRGDSNRDHADDNVDDRNRVLQGMLLLSQLCEDVGAAAVRSSVQALRCIVVRPAAVAAHSLCACVCSPFLCQGLSVLAARVVSAVHCNGDDPVLSTKRWLCSI